MTGSTAKPFLVNGQWVKTSSFESVHNPYSGELLATSDKSAFRLRGEVTSPGGTTAAAMHVLEDGGFRALVEDAVQAAAQRSRDLGRGQSPS